ncbi:MAG: hypothetical protein IKW27_03320 [Bacteroidales bacterium]|nr:hypothetical protein [Bacteroidales bacterium]
MKLIYKLFAAAASILALSSCVENAIEDLTGKYEKPVVHEMNTLVSQSVEKGEKTRTFTVEIAGDNAALTMVMVGDKYFLADGSYTPATADQAKKNTYIVGNGGTTFNNIPVEGGSLKVTQGEGTYSFAGILWLADESVIEVKSTVNLVYEADPEPVKLNTVISATSNVASGTPSLTINLATDGITATYDPNTWSNVYSGTGNYLALDIYSEDGYLHEGTYTASATGGAINPGEFGIGWDPGDLWGIGMVFENWGTCWWDINNGVVTINQKVTEGTVTVTRKGSKWVIELVSGEGKSMLWTKFEGAIEAVTDPALGGGGNVDNTDYVELTNLLSATSNVANGTKSLTMNLGTDGISSTTDPTTWQTVWEGEGNYLGLDIYSEDGKLYTGTYNACAAGGAINAGEFGIGWDPGDLWGIGMVFENWGTCWWNVAGGAAVAAGKVTDGTVEVLVEGANLVIKLKSSLVNARFTYPVADYPLEVVNLGGGEEPEFEGTELSVLLSATSNVANGTNSVTINLAEEGISSTTDANWQTTWEGEGHYLALDVYSADGKLAPGTYTACAAGGQIAEGEFGIGWDPGDLWGIGMVFENWGTCWWAVADGAAVCEAKVLDGTLTVSVDGDVYTITLESSAVNAQYVGPMTL